MNRIIANAIRRTAALVLTIACVAGTSLVTAAESGYYLAGLGLHQETGRDIYLGGLYLQRGTAKPVNLEQLLEPMIMEYRIVARRTSIRSLLGGLLLQSEIATGRAPSSATSYFADAILSNVRTSLYAGDSLQIRFDAQRPATASLNGHVLATASSAEVANYLFIGWVSENGPSTSFRSALLAPELPADLLTLHAGNTFSRERAAEIATWVPQGDTAPQDSTDATLSEGLQTEFEPDIATAAEAFATTDEVVLRGVDNSPDLVLEPFAINLNTYAPAAAGAGLQIASLVPQDTALRDTLLDSEILALGVQEYAQRLSQFHAELVAMVYGQIRYPRRAVRRNLQGRLELDITLRDSGELVAVSVAQSSGHQLLDNAAVEAAENALSGAGFAAIDAVAVAEFGSEVDRLTVPVPVNFKLME